MAHFETTIDTSTNAESAFDYLADFSNARFWDPSVSAGRRLDADPIGMGSGFEIELGFAGRSLAFHYEIVRYEPHRLLALEATTDRIRSLDTIEFEPRESGCRVRYDADLRLRGGLALLDPAFHLAFQVSGRRSADGLARALDALPRAKRSQDATNPPDAQRASDRRAG